LEEAAFTGSKEKCLFIGTLAVGLETWLVAIRQFGRMTAFSSVIFQA